jgi:hypothetical protein
MGDIIEFPGKTETDGHLTGPARCMGCGHEWQAVAPVGTVDNLECSQCRGFLGILVYPVMPESYWVCGECNCHIFAVSGISKEILCYRCGSIQRWES